MYKRQVADCGTGIEQTEDQKTVFAQLMQIENERNTQFLQAKNNRKRAEPVSYTQLLVHNAGSVLVIINSALLLQWKQNK